jgi:hypothetical protein
LARLHNCPIGCWTIAECNRDIVAEGESAHEDKGKGEGADKGEKDANQNKEEIKEALRTTKFRAFKD